MRIGACEVCAAKDEIILDLRKQLEETLKSLLALADARAAAIRYPPERPPREQTAPVKPPNTPDRARLRMHVPEMRPEEVEARFDEQASLERQLGQG